MNILLVNGGPRKNWNTDLLLQQTLAGAASGGANAEMVYLYDLKFRGCVSCMACKLRKEPRPDRCVLRDDLTAVLDKAHEADALVLGSPIYFGEVTGMMRCFLERLLFQYLNYDDHTKPLSPRKKTAMLYTMNAPESMFSQIGYDAVFQRYESWMKLYFGSCTTLTSTETMQVGDYNRYHLGMFCGEDRKRRHETVFPEDCRKAYDLGRQLAAPGD